MFDTRNSGPRSRACHICGRQALIAGFDNHVVQCKKTFLKQQELLPLGQRKRLPPDPVSGMGGAGPSADGRPATAGATSKLTRAELDELNAAARAMHDEAFACPCPYCGRTFESEARLTVHHKSCTAERPAKRVGTSRLSEASASPLTKKKAAATAQPRSALADTVSGLTVLKRGVQRRLFGMGRTAPVAPQRNAPHLPGGGGGDGGGDDYRDDDYGDDGYGGAGEDSEGGRALALSARADRVESVVASVASAVAEVGAVTPSRRASRPARLKTMSAASESEEGRVTGLFGGQGAEAASALGAPSDGGPEPLVPGALAPSPGDGGGGAGDLARMRARLGSRSGNRLPPLSAGPGEKPGSTGGGAGGSGGPGGGMLAALEERTGAIEAALVGLLGEIRDVRALLHEEAQQQAQQASAEQQQQQRGGGAAEIELVN